MWKIDVSFLYGKRYKQYGKAMNPTITGKKYLRALYGVEICKDLI